MIEASDPAHVLLRQLVPGEPVSVRQASLATGIEASILKTAATALADLCPELSLPDGLMVLSRPLDVFEPAQLRDQLEPSFAARVERCAVYAMCESTSLDEATMAVEAPHAWRLTFAEYQSGGRGRHGRHWHSGFAEGICMTLATRVPKAIRIAPTLTLALGVALAESLDEWLTEAVLVKWPNDLILGNGKLGGILVEVSTRPDMDQLVRIGTGINGVAPTDAVTYERVPAVPPAGLASYASQPIERTPLAARLANATVAAFDRHQREGLAPFLDAWAERDYLKHQPVQVFDQDQVKHGTATGIDASGALLVSSPEGVLSLTSGEVRVRRRD